MKIYKIIMVALILVFGITLNSIGQEEKKKADVYMEVDEMPIFPGGDEALIKFIAENVKYPVEAKKQGIIGKVFVSFVIDEKGKVIEPKIERGVDPLLDKESLRVIGLLPDWTPGKNDGKLVKVQFTVPINYALH